MAYTDSRYDYPSEKPFEDGVAVSALVQLSNTQQRCSSGIRRRPQSATTMIRSNWPTDVQFEPKIIESNMHKLPPSGRSTASYSHGGTRSNVPQYVPFDDPHLRSYYINKFRKESTTIGRPSQFLPLDAAVPKPPAREKPKHYLVFKVAVKTADIPKAGTSSPIYITLKGTHGKSPRTRLMKKSAKISKNHRNPPFTFSRGARQVFAVKSTEIGDVKSCILEHDSMNEEEGWFCEFVEVYNTRNNKTWTFHCNKWFSLFRTEGMTARQLFAEVMPNTEYKVVVITGDKRDCNTDARVFLTLFGKSAASPRIELKSTLRDGESTLQPFSVGETDVYIVQTCSVGPLEKLRMQHDASGNFNNWFLERVVITDLRNPKWTYYFPFGQWLSREKGDGSIVREVRGSKDAAAKARISSYKVTIYTGDREECGCDCDVICNLIGREGESGERKLIPERKVFLRGGKDEFLIECQTLGTLKRLRLGHNNKGLYTKWYVQKVIVDDLNAHRVYEFPCHNWFCYSLGDRKLQRELRPTGDTKDDEKDGADSKKRPNRKINKEMRGETDYEIRVITGDKHNASTSSEVYVIIHADREELKTWVAPEKKTDSAKKRKTDKDEEKVKQEEKKKWAVTDDKDEHSSKRPSSRNGPSSRSGSLASLDRDKRDKKSKLSSSDDDSDSSKRSDKRSASRNGRNSRSGSTASLKRDKKSKFSSSDDDSDSSKRNDKRSGSRNGPSNRSGSTASLKRDQKSKFSSSDDDSDSSKRGNKRSGSRNGPSNRSGSTASLKRDKKSKFSSSDDDSDGSKRNDKRPASRNGPSNRSGSTASLKRDKKSKFSSSDDDSDSSKRNDKRSGSRNGPSNRSGSTASLKRDQKSKFKDSDDEDENYGKKRDDKRSSSTNGKSKRTGSQASLDRGKPGRRSASESSLSFSSDDDEGRERSASRAGKGSKADLRSRKTSVTKFGSRSSLRSASKNSSVSDSASDSGERTAKTRKRKLSTEKGDKEENKPLNLVSSDRIDLKNGTFKKGQTDVFKIQLPTLLSPACAITVGIRPKGMNSSWFCDQIVLVCPKTGLQQTFVVNDWLSLDEGDRKTERYIKETKSLRKYMKMMQEWTVKVHTSDIQFADEDGTSLPGTDSHVFVTLYGEKGKNSGEISLNTEVQRYERNSVDTERITAAEVGLPSKMRVRLDGRGVNPGWHLKKIELIDEGTKDKDCFEFLCDKWLHVKDGEDLYIREMPAAGPGIKEPLPLTTYVAKVTTGKKPFAGTDARILLNIFGDIGDTGERPLTKSHTHRKPFQEGNTDEFRIEAVYLGKIKKIRIGHYGTAPGDGWFLDNVTIAEVGHERDEIKFECNRWLDAKEDDGLTMRELFIGSDILETNTYIVSVKTGDVSGAGTDARVHLQIHGSKGQTAVMPLKNPISPYTNKFERNQTDKFRLSVGDVGKIKKIRISHDNTGASADWYLEDVIIQVPSQGKEYVFVARRWLKQNDDKSVELELEPSDVRKFEALIPYDIQIWTGQKKNAGTDANVILQIYGVRDGEQVKTDEIKLQNKSDNFEKGSLDKFKVDARDVGRIQKIRIGHDNTGGSPGWYLDKLLIQKPVSAKRKNDDEKDDAAKKRPRRKSSSGNRDDSSDQDERDKRDRRSSTGSQDRRGSVAPLGGSRSGSRASLRGSRASLKDKESERGRDRKDRRGSSSSEDSEDERAGSRRGDDRRSEKEKSSKGKRRDSSSDSDEDNKGNKRASGRRNSSSSSTDQRRLSRDDDKFRDRDSTGGKDRRGSVAPQGGSRSGSRASLRGSRASLKDKDSERGRDRKDRRGSSSSEDSEDDRGSKQRNARSSDQRKTSRDDEKSRGGRSASQSSLRKQDRRAASSESSSEEDLRQGSQKLKRTGRRNSSESSEERGGSKAGGARRSSVRKDDESDKNRNQRKRKSSRDSDDDDRKNKPERKNSRERRDADSDSDAKSKKNRNARKGEDSDQDGDNRKKKDLLEVADGIESYWFFADRWLAKDEGDKQIIIELLPKTKDGQSLSGLEEINYVVRVKTGDKNGAGTDASVFIKLVGKKGDSGERQLSKSENLNKFERNQIDTFKVKCADLGKLDYVRLRESNTGAGADWYVDYVEVVDEKHNKTFICPCKKWFSATTDGGQLARDLPAFDDLATIEKVKKGADVDTSLAAKDKLHTFHVSIITGDKMGAGTDASVFINMFGKKSDTGPIPLKKSKTNMNKFERNQTDEFEIDLVDIGEIERIKIWHDNTGPTPDWYLDKIIVECPTLGYKYLFPCGRWLANNRDDGATERELYPQESATEKFEKFVPYEIITYTSNKMFAGTSAIPYICLYGRELCTQQKDLIKKEQAGKFFKQGNTDKFIIELEEIDEPIEKIRIGHNNAGMSPGWHVDKVEVRKLRKEKQETVTYIFPCGRWLARDEDDRQICRDLVANKVIKDSLDERGRPKHREKERRDSLKMKKYSIKVYTGEGATDADIFLKVFGDYGDSGERELNKSEHLNKFEKNQMDTFTWECADLGKIYKVEIRSSGTSIKPEWKLDRIEVFDVADKNEKYEFICERWLSSKRDDKKLKRTLYVKGYQGDMSSTSTLRSTNVGSSMSLGSSLREPFSRSPSGRRTDEEEAPDGPVIPYTIKIRTGSEKDQGTSSRVWIKLFNSKGQNTGKQTLRLASNDRFEPGSVETFSFDAPDIKTVSEIEICKDDPLPKTGWFVETIEVIMPTKGKNFKFDVKQWLAQDKGDGKVKRTLSINDGSSSKSTFSALVPYEVTVNTGDMKDAGTDAKFITLQLFGQKGTSEEIKIEKIGDRFERAKSDTIRMESENVGKLRKLRVTLGQTKDRPSWLLDSIQLRNMNTMDLYKFEFGDWLSTKKGRGVTSVDLPAYLNGEIQVKEKDYRIKVRTSDVFGAGTEAKVFIRLFGENGDSNDLHLQKSDNRSPFQQNQTDVFNVKILDLGEISRCRVWHDNAGVGAAWHLNDIEVEDVARKSKYLFTCNKWLSKSDDDRQIVRELTCQVENGPKGSRDKDTTEYTFEITTSDKRGASMRHNLWMQLEGESGPTKDLLVKNSSDKRYFEHGNTDTVSFTTRSVGKLRKIHLLGVKREDIELDPAKAEWHCHEVAVIDSQSGQRYIFEVRDWIPVCPKLSAAKVQSYIVKRTEMDSTKALQDTIRKSATVKYEVKVKTGDQFGSGTNANVFITLFGKLGDTGKRELEEDINSRVKDKFERNQLDTFMIEATDVGDLRKIIIEHDNTGFRPGWFLESVEVRNVQSDKSWFFQCNEWLDKDKGDKQIFKELFPERPSSR